MNIELLIKIFALVVSAIGTWMAYSQLARSRKTTLRDEYRFAKEFMNDLKSDKLITTYLKDKGYEALIGITSLTTREIEFLLSLPEPARSLREFVSGRKYLEHVPTAGEKPLMLKKRYRKPSALRRRGLFFMILFAVFYTFIWLPIFLPDWITFMGLRMSSALSLTIVLFAPFTYLFFRMALNVTNARAVLRRAGVREDG
jgi:hypothetical protein